MGRLEGKVAMITGAAGGIGSVAGRVFADEGARVLLVDRDEEALVAAAAAIGEPRARHFVADVTKADEVRACTCAAAEHFGGLDVAILNAGIEGEVRPIKEYPDEVFDQVIAVNLRGVWLGLKYAIPEMERRGGGSIVITSSIAGVRGRPGLCAYVASKHAIVGLMRTAALECAAAGIRVNTVNPSPVETRMMRSLERGAVPDDPESAKRAFERASPLGHYAEPEEVAKLMLFLASDESSHCSGSVYMLDGARTAR
jgi:NAD(P)-dependent dehydrogenase (short-subunit alcohol dehydrogenase family)